MLEKDKINEQENTYPLGGSLFIKREAKSVEVWRNGGFLFKRDVETRAKSPELRWFIVELVNEYKAQKTKLSIAFSVSRQSINDWVASYEKHGLKGLENSTKNIGNSSRTKGNKSKINTADIQHKKQEISNLQLNIKDIKVPEIPTVSQSESAYEKTVAKQENRYAGVFVMQILLTSYFSWFNWIVGLFGDAYKIFQIFSFMCAKNIRSIEQLKNVRSKEAGAILGLSKLPSLPGIWALFYQAHKKKLSKKLLALFFAWQIGKAKVNNRFWFTDGHVLPYTGKEKMHKIFNTKKREVEPGCISFVTCDFAGQIVDFELKEGGSGLREHIINLHNKWSKNFDKKNFPVHVFDREGDGCEFFYNLTKLNCPFITWEKNANRKKLYEKPKIEFGNEFVHNNIKYLFYENNKNYIYKDASEINHKFTLRRFGIINTRSNKRTSALAFSGEAKLSQSDCIYGILNRWGASENTFKHLGNKQPLSYRPGFRLQESKNQTVKNPEIKILDKKIKKQEKEYTRQCKVLATKEKVFNKSGEERKKGAYNILKSKIKKIKEIIKELKYQKSEQPQRINISELTDYKEFKKHENEGKNLFDFVNSLCWNARKKGVQLLKNCYPHKNDIVDLFYAITNCSGSIQITETTVKVILEPLEQTSRRIAQIEFCEKLTQLEAKTPFNKKMIIEVKI